MTHLPMWWPEWLVCFVGRNMCRLFGWHNETCRGMADHRWVGGRLHVIAEVPPPRPAPTPGPPPDFDD